MEPTDSQRRKLKTAYNKGHRLALVKILHGTIRMTGTNDRADIQKMENIMDEHPDTYAIEEIYMLIN